MLELLFKSFILVLPAGMANMSPVLFKWLPILNYPIDFNLNFRGKPLLGNHKTFRGFFVGILMAILTVYAQTKLCYLTPDYYLTDYTKLNIWYFGSLLGFGALFGDSLKSFFKRRTNIPPGGSWIPFDQIDWIIGSLVFAGLAISIPWQIILLSIILFGLLHPIINILAYFLRIKKTLL